MASMRFPLVFALAVTSSLWLPGSWAQEPSAQPRAKPTATDEPATALSQLAPGTVASTYVDGRLTVKARNARLIDVLYSACDLIGAQLNAPEDADQPILRAVGPARPVDVLASLLRNSSYNYSITGSANDANAVVGVTVFPKDKKEKKVSKDKEADSPSPAEQAAQQVRDLMALAQTELADSRTVNAADAGQEGDASNADSNSADASNPRADAFMKALQADPSLISKLEARIDNPDAAAAGTEDYSNPAGPPPMAPPDPGLGHRHHHR
jgi:hypothetical protein